jgi:hypothetical protein
MKNVVKMKDIEVYGNIVNAVERTLKQRGVKRVNKSDGRAFGRVFTYHKLFAHDEDFANYSVSLFEDYFEIRVILPAKIDVASEYRLREFEKYKTFVNKKLSGGRFKFCKENGSVLFSLQRQIDGELDQDAASEKVESAFDLFDRELARYGVEALRVIEGEKTLEKILLSEELKRQKGSPHYFAFPPIFSAASPSLIKFWQIAETTAYSLADCSECDRSTFASSSH